MLQVSQLTKGFAGQVIFQDVTWHISDGDRIGLTGPNGSGKTTLLRILTGLDSADAGDVVMPRGTSLGYLPQDGLYHKGCSLQEEAMTAFADALALRDEGRRLEETMSDLDSESPQYQSVLQRYGEIQDEWEQLGGFGLEAQVAEVLAGLGFRQADLPAPTETFSGGWQMRIALGKLLLQKPNLLLLDEPTNHLDLEARNWLEDYLAAYPYAVVLVSHDRYFLDRVVTRITEIDRRRLVDYTGNYSYYLEVREKQMAELRARAARQQEEIERVKRFIERFRYKATKAAQVQSRVKMLEKMEIIDIPPERKILKLKLPEPVRSGRIVLELEGVTKRYGDKLVFDSIDLLVERGDRIALVGPNGAGKSTLMRLLADEEPLDSGERKLGHKAEVSFFSQERYFNLDENKTVLENLMEAAHVSLVPQLRNILGAFLFHGDDVDKKAKVLSGGEESRLALAKLLLQPANTLLLDEPTNHLDIDSKEVLLHALKTYKGTLVFVSHDRYFIDALATKIIEVGEGSAKMYWGNYEDYLYAKEAALEPVVEQLSKDKPRVSTKAKPRTTTSKNQARKLREELSRLEESIAETETAIASLEGRMSMAGFYDDPDAAAEIVQTHQDLKSKLETLYGEWEALAAQQEGAP
jgi:ATP-binding cassette subfamily F protein 3